MISQDNASAMESGGNIRPIDISISLKEWTANAINSMDTLSSLRDNANKSLIQSYVESYGSNPSTWPYNVKKKLVTSSLGPSCQGKGPACTPFYYAALKIAHSLADQISTAEEFFSSHKGDSAENRNSEGDSNFIHFLPAPGSNWIDRASVHLKSNVKSCTISSDFNNANDNGRDTSRRVSDIDEEQDELNGNNREENVDTQSDGDEWETVLNSFVNEPVLFQMEADKDLEAVQEDQRIEGNSVHCLSVERAEILPSYVDDIHARLDLDSPGRIYSLGVIFYQLFSGNRPPEIANIVKETTCESNVHADDLFNPLPTNQVNTIDLAGALQILERLEGDNDKYYEGSHCGDHSNKQSRSSQPEVMSIISVEPLKTLGLPTRLCDLIANMLDCANGDLSSDDAYTKMSDITSDLLSMIDNPDKFLRDLDVDKLSLSGLQVDDGHMFGREKEFCALRDSYQNTISGDHQEFAVISGHSGTGKTMLAHRLEKFVRSNGGLYLAGKFDLLKQRKPFSAVTQAFNEYCTILMEGDSNRAASVSSKLKAALGEDARHLSKVIPNLCRVIGINNNEDLSAPRQDDCVDAQKRLQYLLSKFVEIISSCSDAPIVLFLDDLQWADPASVDVINKMLLSGSSKKKTPFYFFGCCRPDEMSDDHPFKLMVSGIRLFDICATEIDLGCMDKSMTNTVVSSLLCLSPRLTRPLSDIVYHKTQGNPHFVSQLMMALNKEGLLRLSLIRRKWEWDEEKIQSRDLPDDVVEFFTRTICELPCETQEALQVLACFGACTELFLIEAIEKKLNKQLVSPLDIAVEEGLLTKSSDTFSFVHDRIQEATYQMIEPTQKPLLHFQYGIALVPLSDFSENHSVLFPAVDQINRGSPSIVDNVEQAVMIAELNLKAGMQAIEMSDFGAAFSFFDNGISFLPKKHWSVVYDLSLKLFQSAATCSLATGDFVSLEILSSQILKNAKSLKDQLHTLHIQMAALCYAFKLPEAIEKGLSILKQLGEGIPDNSSESEIEFIIVKTEIMLSGLSDDDLLSYKSMTDTSKIMAMKFLSSLLPFMSLVKPEIQPFVTTKMVQLSLEYGMSTMSPVGFVFFGSLVAKFGNIQEGCRLVKIASRLSEKLGSKQGLGEVFSVGVQVRSFVEPLQVIPELHRQGINAAMAAGDTSQAMVNSILNVGCLCWSGANLQQTKRAFNDAQRFMEHHRNMTWLSLLLPIGQKITLLIGPDNASDDPGGASLSSFESAKDLANLEANPYHALHYYFEKMDMSFIVRNYDELFRYAERYYSCILSFRGNVLVFGDAHRDFMTGLMSYWVYRKTKSSVWLERGKQSKLALKKYSETSEWNFLQKFLLLEAEENFCSENIPAAKLSYDNAIALAREHKLITDEALACELAGYFFLESCETGNSMACLKRSHEQYHEWGAFAKSKMIHSFVKNFLDPSLNHFITSVEPYVVPNVESKKGNADFLHNNTHKRTFKSVHNSLDCQNGN